MLKVHSASIPVTDLDRALAFYVDVLGWQKMLDVSDTPAGRFVTVAPTSDSAQIALADAAWFNHGARKETGISLVTDDIDGVYATLRDRGVSFRGPVETMPWGGRATWLEDPDGNLLYLVG